MSNTLHAFEFLNASEPVDVPSVCVLFGNEPFLKRLVRQKLLRSLMKGEDVPYGQFDGQTCQWRDIKDEVATVSLFGGGGSRLAVVDDADPFVSNHRGVLEDYLSRSERPGVLLLDVTKWQSNTRLYKLTDACGLQVACKAPEYAGRRKGLDEKKLCDWLVKWALVHHRITLEPRGSQMLLETGRSRIWVARSSTRKTCPVRRRRPSSHARNGTGYCWRLASQVDLGVT